MFTNFISKGALDYGAEDSGLDPHQDHKILNAS